MYKNFSILLLCFFFVLSANLQSEEIKQPLTAMYIIPEYPCEYITQGQPLLLLESAISCIKTSGSKHFLHFSYESYEQFLCTFKAARESILTPGIYKIDSSHGSPHVDFSGAGRGASSSFNCGEFEIFEIEYDDQGKLLSFAADFKIGTYSKASIRGAVRFNSIVPVNEYFIQMADPSFNYSSHQLFYVEKQLAYSSDRKVIIAEDKRKLDISLIDNNGLDLIIHGNETCWDKYKMIFHIPILDSLINKNSFIVEDKNDNYSKNWIKKRHYDSDSWDNDDYSDLDDLDIEKGPSITLSNRHEGQVIAKFGIFTISELTIEVKSKKITSLALDFIFRDDHENVYEGTIRHNSTIAIPVELNLKSEN